MNINECPLLTHIVELSVKLVGRKTRLDTVTLHIGLT